VNSFSNWLQPDKTEESKAGGLMNKALQFGFNALMGTLLERVDLSDVDIEKISGQLQKHRQGAGFKR